MSARGSASKSSTGAAMSKYDVEVEARLQKLESQAHTPCGGGSDNERVAALEKRLEEVIAVLKQASPGVAKNL